MHNDTMQNKTDRAAAAFRRFRPTKARPGLTRHDVVTRSGLTYEEAGSALAYLQRRGDVEVVGRIPGHGARGGQKLCLFAPVRTRNATQEDQR